MRKLSSEFLRMLTLAFVNEGLVADFKKVFRMFSCSAAKEGSVRIVSAEAHTQYNGAASRE